MKYLICLLLVSCGLTRKVQKEQVKTDSVRVETYDTASLRKFLDQTFESRTSKTTSTEKSATVQPIIVEGKTQYITVPYERTTTTDNSEILSRLQASIDSMKANNKDSAQVTTETKKKDVDSQFGLTGFQQMLVYLAFGAGAVWYLGRKK